MIDLVARQIQILRAVIEEFIETAEPVGSDTIDKKFNIGVSPATIRNEMVYLTKQGYLTKSHTSAGRLPTPLAMRLYVNELMRERVLSVADEVGAKEKIWQYRNEVDDLLYESVRVLADKSRALAVAFTPDHRLVHSGYANLLAMPEFYDIKVMRHVLALIEHERLMEEVFSFGVSENPVHVVFGHDLGNSNLEPVSILYMDVETGGQHCKLGVVGSFRFDYPYVIPMMKYFKGLIEDLTS